MKKILVFLLTCVMTFAFTACKVRETTPIAVLEAKNCYGNAGYTELISGAEQSSEYTFTAEQSDGVTWSVYLFDQPFDDGFRYIAQAAKPVLVGDGTISVAAGQFVYVYCSANEFTADAAAENAKLNVSVK